MRHIAQLHTWNFPSQTAEMQLESWFHLARWIGSSRGEGRKRKKKKKKKKRVVQGYKARTVTSPSYLLSFSASFFTFVVERCDAPSWCSVNSFALLTYQRIKTHIYFTLGMRTRIQEGIWHTSTPASSPPSPPNKKQNQPNRKTFKEHLKISWRSQP